MAAANVKSTGLYLFLLTGHPPYGAPMASYEVTLKEGSTERIGDADAYEQEGPMTTFFRTGGRTVDSWSTRVASLRTADILIIRRQEEPIGFDDGVAAVHRRSA